MPFRDYIYYYFPILLQFVVIYGATNWLQSTYQLHWQWYFNWETAIPLVPWTIMIYLSVFLLVLLPPFLLDRKAIDLLKAKIHGAIAVSGFFLSLFPWSWALNAGTTLHCRDYGKMFSA